jgi:hypothetical protein
MQAFRGRFSCFAIPFPFSTLAPMCRLALILILAIAPSTIWQGQEVSAGELQPVPAPALPHFDWGACPFEGCTYRQWTARKSIIVYDTWKQRRREVGQLSMRDKVIAVTGVVITFRPGVVRMDRGLPDRDLKRGDVILTYTNRGEGFSAVWYKGHYYSEFDITFTRWPDGQGCGGTHCAATYIDLGKKAWWAKVKLMAGRVGWIDMTHADFDGIDLLAQAAARDDQNGRHR